MTKAALVTGAAGGIGKAIARRLAREGWFVGLTDIDQAGAAATLAAEGQGRGLAIGHDVCDPASWDGAFAAFTAASGGQLDALVNNAGVLRFGWFEELTPADIIAQVDVNVRGVALGALAALPYLRATPGSCLINIASAASLVAAPKLAVYSATKFAVRGLSEALDLEFARFGVRVACIDPYLVDTAMIDSVDAEGSRFRDAARNAPVLTPDDVAEAVWAATSGDALHYPVGEPPAALLNEITPRLEATRQAWRERAGRVDY